MSSQQNKRNELNIPFFVPYGQHPNPEPIEYSAIERVFKYDASKKNIVLTDEIRNVQIEINAFKDGTQIYDILDKYAGTPDISQIPELNTRIGNYADISELPNNIHDLQNIIKNASFKLKELNNADINKINEINSENKNENSQQKTEQKTQEKGEKLNE